MNIENTQEYMEQIGLFVVVSNTNLSEQEIIECIWQRDKKIRNIEKQIGYENDTSA